MDARVQADDKGNWPERLMQLKYQSLRRYCCPAHVFRGK